MERLPVEQLDTKTAPIDLGDAKAYHLPDWQKMTHPQRLAVMRQIAMGRGRDPRIAKLAVSILKKANAGPRQYDHQAAALLRWVQDPKNVYYVNEPGERLQDPIYTIQAGHGDCFAKDTLVLREDMEYVKIQDVQVGSRIWGKDRWSTVVNFWEKGDLPITEIELNNGSVLRLTEDHKVYVKSCEMHGPSCKDLTQKRRNCKERSFEWVRIPVSELTEGMMLLQPDRILPEMSDMWDADTSWLLGAYLAEGWMEDSRIAISGKDGHWKEQTKHRAKAIAESKGWNIRWHAKYLAINSKEAVSWVSACGKGAIHKTIPLEAMRNADALALDEGLQLDASRNTRGEGWTFGSVSERLALQYRTLQRVLGRSTSWSKVEDHGGLGKNPIYRVGVRNPSINADRKLRVKEIRRQVEVGPCYDIATDDHYVYLPEADCTVSNCDDQVILLAALYESVGLPWKFVLSGRSSHGEKVRHIEGDRIQDHVRWTHIYLCVGTPPFGPTRWYFCETTIVGVPLGWDVVSGDASYLPEMGGAGEAPRLRIPGPPPKSYRPSPLPPPEHRSPAYDAALADVEAVLADALAGSSLVGGTVGGYIAKETMDQEVAEGKSKWREWGAAIATGVLVSVGTTLALDFINGSGLWKGKGTLMERLRS